MSSTKSVMQILPENKRQQSLREMPIDTYSITFFRNIGYSPQFDKFYLLVILVNATGAAVSCSHRTTTSDTFGVVMTSLFAVIGVVKMLGLGLSSYFKDSWNILFFVIIVSAIYADVLRMGNGHYILVVLTFTLIRTVKLLRKWGDLRVSIGAVIASMTVLSNFALTLLMFIFPTAVILTAYIGQNSRLSNKETDEGTKNIELWGNLPKSMLSLFQIATLDWGDIVRASVMDEPALAIVFILFILATGFAVSNVFITIIGEKYNERHEEWEQELDDIELYEDTVEKDDILLKMQSGSLGEQDIDLNKIKELKFDNTDIAVMLLTLQCQLNKMNPNNVVPKKVTTSPPKQVTVQEKGEQE